MALAFARCSPREWNTRQSHTWGVSLQTDAILKWLLDQGGPVIRYRTARELMSQQSGTAHRNLLDDLLRTERVQWLLQQMSNFGPIEHLDIGVLNSLHGMKPTCLENVIARLLELGLHAGIPVFDHNMDRFRSYVDNKLVRRALDGSADSTIGNGRAVFIATVLASYFVRGGYYHDEVLQFVNRRLDLTSRVASLGDYNIHLRSSELTDLPKKWTGKPILRPEMDPLSGSTPLPLIHDFFAFAYLPHGRLSRQARKSLDDIVSYVTTHRYSSLPVGYGYIWPKADRGTCYACGWSLDLPDVASHDPFSQRKIMQQLELLSRLPAAHHSPWFQAARDTVERFRLGKETYCFPRPYLQEFRSGYYAGGEYMGLEDNRQQLKAIELESTFRMLLFHKAMTGRRRKAT